MKSKSYNSQEVAEMLLVVDNIHRCLSSLQAIDFVLEDSRTKPSLYTSQNHFNNALRLAREKRGIVLEILARECENFRNIPLYLTSHLEGINVEEIEMKYGLNKAAYFNQSIK